MVGTLGNRNQRLAPVEAIGTRRPDSMKSLDNPSPNATWISLLSRAGTTGGPPLYGTMVMGMPSMSPSMTARRWLAPPSDDRPQFNLPGLAFSHATMPLMSRKPVTGLVVSTNGLLCVD